MICTLFSIIVVLIFSFFKLYSKYLNLKESFPLSCNYIVVYHKYSWCDGGWIVDYFEDDVPEKLVQEKAKKLGNGFFGKVNYKILKVEK